jgi:hypothetical protein
MPIDSMTQIRIEIVTAIRLIEMGSPSGAREKLKLNEQLGAFA